MTAAMASAARLHVGRRQDGALRLTTDLPLTGADSDIADKLRHWASAAPDRVLLTAPDGVGGRDSVSYAGALQAARGLHGRLAAQGLRPGARVASLLPASMEGLHLRLACLLGGYVHITLPPHPFRGAHQVPPPSPEAARLWRVAAPDLLILPQGHAATGPALALADLPVAPPAPDHPATPQDWTAIFFTSGSTGAAKGVPITRGMISSCQAGYAVAWPFLTDRPPVLIDWMPWNHVFGGLDNIFKIIWNGGSLHLSPPPSADGMGALLDLMAQVQPTLSIGVPLGLRLLLEAWDSLPDHVAQGCAALRHIFFAGAAMDPALWQRLERFRAAMASRHGHRITVLSGYGATEAASTMCLVPGDIAAPGVLGWPLPGHEIALVDDGGLAEIRFRGPNLAPCYLGEDGPFPLPLDDQGYYRTGDAGLLAPDAQGQPMLRFDGRIAEDFKLSSGIKVRAGLLRADLLQALGPLASDLVLGGAGGEGLVALIFAAPGTEAALALALGRWNQANPASSTAIRRFALADFIPSADQGELSAKGQLVQSRIQRNHAGIFAALMAGQSGWPPRAASPAH